MLVGGPYIFNPHLSLVYETMGSRKGQEFEKIEKVWMLNPSLSSIQQAVMADLTMKANYHIKGDFAIARNVARLLGSHACCDESVL